MFVSKTEAKSSVLTAPGSSSPSTPPQDPVDGRDLLERLGVEDHQLLLDPERERRARAERVRDHAVLDAVHRAAGGDPRVVRGARAVLGAVAGDARVAADVARARGVTQEVRVVVLLPHEDQVRRGHELGDERAAGGRARERIRAHAEPPVVVTTLVVLPQLDVFELGDAVLENDLPALHRAQGSDRVRVSGRPAPGRQSGTGRPSWSARYGPDLAPSVNVTVCFWFLCQTSSVSLSPGCLASTM